MTILVDVVCHVPEGIEVEGIAFNGVPPLPETISSAEPTSEASALDASLVDVSAPLHLPDSSVRPLGIRSLYEQNAQDYANATRIDLETWLNIKQHHPKLIADRVLVVDASEELMAMHALKLRYFAEFEREGYAHISAQMQGELPRTVRNLMALEWLELSENTAPLTQESWKIRSALFAIVFVLAMSLLAYFK